MLTAIRYVCGVLSLALLGQWNGLVPEASSARAGEEALALAKSLAPLIAALLDTTVAGSARAADLRLGLQAGADVRAFYGPGHAPAWATPPDSLSPDAQAALALLGRAADYGLRPADYGEPQLRARRDSLGQPGEPAQRAGLQARLDVYLSDAVLRFMRDLSRGRLQPATWSARERAAGRAWEPAPVLRAALGTEQVPAAMLAGQPTNREYRLLQQALGEWLARPAALADSADPAGAARRQAHYEQVAVNLERWRWDAWPADTGAYALVNLPAFELSVIAHDSVLRRHRVIVGKPQTPTPTLSSRIGYFTLAPDWRTPYSIATQEYLPRLKEDAGYLRRHNLALYDRRGRRRNPYHIDWDPVTAENFPFTIRQEASADNTLGSIVFRFANPYEVYVHDTPLRLFFKPPSRAFSHGCIRLDQPLALADYLLRHDGQPQPPLTAAECARLPRPRNVYLRHPLPLHVRYATCAVEKGRLRFFDDVYQCDELVRQGLFGPRP